MSEIFLENAFVPEANLLGKIGGGFAGFMLAMEWERLGLFASSLGAMDRQLEETVAYAITEGARPLDRPLTRADLRLASPYNTYLVEGLPPGPICNPSLDAIKAALFPEPNKYWFFLSGNDGRMHYARTLEEHTANRYKYLR